MPKKRSASAKGRLLEFYGTECVHCKEMDPIIQRVEKEAKMKIIRLETWHNSTNAKLLEKYDNGFCGGVPFFYNENTGEKICGEAPFDKLLKWAKKKPSK